MLQSCLKLCIKNLTLYNDLSSVCYKGVHVFFHSCYGDPCLQGHWLSLRLVSEAACSVSIFHHGLRQCWTIYQTPFLEQDRSTLNGPEVMRKTRFKVRKQRSGWCVERVSSKHLWPLQSVIDYGKAKEVNDFEGSHRSVSPSKMISAFLLVLQIQFVFTAKINKLFLF